MKKSRGFTLIEILVVIVILSILAGLVVPRLLKEPDKAKIVKAKLQIGQLEMALKRFKLDNGFYPSTEQGLEALVKKPTIGREPKHYPPDGYLDKIPLDPWGNPYVYVCPGEHGDFDLLSLGADGIEGGEGPNKDIGNWELE